jgi:hypothetical protein
MTSQLFGLLMIASILWAGGEGGTAGVVGSADAAPDPPAGPPPLFVVGHLQRYAATGDGSLRDRNERVRLMRELGFTGTRLGFEWNHIEARRGAPDWSRQDSILGETYAVGLVAYGMLGTSPPWARPPGTKPFHRPTVDGSTALGDRAFAAFAASAARRYAGRVDVWEIWNEPNILNFWSNLSEGRERGPDPADYASLFREARDSILAANPHATVVTAGLAPGPTEARFHARRLAGEPVGYPMRTFLEDLLDQTLGVRAVGLHPYLALRSLPRLPPAGWTNRLVRSAELALDGHRLESTPIYVTEWGIDVTETDSAAAVAWFAAGLRDLLCDPRLKNVTIYALADAGGARRFGLVDDRGEPTALGLTLKEIEETYRRGAECP